MSRWEPGTRERLEQAALELFVERGFAETTVPQITERAGVTTRTFFRHFSDKREVLFANETELPALAARMIAEAAPELSPMEIIAGGFEQVVAAQFAEGAEHFVARQSVVYADDGLREREMRKMAALTDALHQGFLTRGSDELTAALTAQVTTTIFGVAITRWMRDRGATPLPELLHDTLTHLRRVMADPGWIDAQATQPESRP